MLIVFNGSTSDCQPKNIIRLYFLFFIFVFFLYLNIEYLHHFKYLFFLITTSIMYSVYGLLSVGVNLLILLLLVGGVLIALSLSLQTIICEKSQRILVFSTCVIIHWIVLLFIFLSDNTNVVVTEFWTNYGKIVYFFCSFFFLMFLPKRTNSNCFD